MAKKISICALILIFVLLLSLAVMMDRKDNSGDFVQHTGDIEFAVKVTPFEEPVRMVNPAIYDWYVNKTYSAKEYYNIYKSELGRLDYPMPVIVRFSVEGIPEGESVSKQTVEVSQDGAFTSPKTYEVELNKKYALIYNLEPAREYFYRVTVTSSGGKTVADSGKFTTAMSPRQLMVDGIRNVRDIGGYNTVDGKKIKYGLFYRGTELRKVKSEHFDITPDGIKVITEDLGLCSELDLRLSHEGGEKIEGTENQYYYAFNYGYSEIFNDEEGKVNKRLCNIFKDLSDEDNYPVYMHCTWGCDRTGTVVYLLQALLGVSEEDCFAEWELSTFFSGGTHETEMAQFVEDINALEGDTLKDKVENYLLSIGVTRKQIKNIRNIYLTDAQ